MGIKSALNITVHDMENLTFSAEFRGCSTWIDADNPRIDHGESAYWPRVIRVVAADNPRGRSVRKLSKNVQKVYADANQQ